MRDDSDDSTEPPEPNFCKACSERIGPFVFDDSDAKYNKTEYCSPCYRELTTGKLSFRGPRSGGTASHVNRAKSMES